MKHTYIENDSSEILTALVNAGHDYEEALRLAEYCIVHPDCHTMEDVAYDYVEETGALSSVPESLRYYFDYEKLGRDLELEGEFIFTTDGNCIEVIY